MGLVGGENTSYSFCWVLIIEILNFKVVINYVFPQNDSQVPIYVNIFWTFLNNVWRM